MQKNIPDATVVDLTRGDPPVPRPKRVDKVTFPIGKNPRRAGLDGSLLHLGSPANLDQITAGSGPPRSVLARVVVGFQCFITHWAVGEFLVPAE